MRKETVVLALGGNALGKNIEEQRTAVEHTARVIVDLAVQGLSLVITHGNGPQVGMIQDAMDNYVVEHADLKQVPLPSSVAMSQGYIGIDLQNAIKYELFSRNMDVKVSTILSQVEVDENDEAFKAPTKPIGRFMSAEEARTLMAEGISCMEDAGRGWRIVVPSPRPRKIRELLTIRTLLEAGHIVITCGGGGIPVISRNGRLVGVNAVIDKDFASALLAEELGADSLIILTAVEKVAVDFGKPDQRWLDSMTTEEAERYISEGQFARGSMLPKVEAAVRFAGSAPGRMTLITQLEKASEGLAGKTGTRIYKEERGGQDGEAAWGGGATVTGEAAGDVRTAGTGKADGAGISMPGAARNGGPEAASRAAGEMPGAADRVTAECVTAAGRAGEDRT